MLRRSTFHTYVWYRQDFSLHFKKYDKTVKNYYYMLENNFNILKKVLEVCKCPFLPLFQRQKISHYFPFPRIFCENRPWESCIQFSHKVVALILNSVALFIKTFSFSLYRSTCFAFYPMYLKIHQDD